MRLLLLALVVGVPAGAQAQYVNFGNLDAYNAQLLTLQRNLMVDVQRNDASTRQRERDAAVWREQYVQRHRADLMRKKRDDDRRRDSEQRVSDDRRRDEDDRRRFDQQRRDEEIRRQQNDDQRRRDEDDRRRRDEERRRR